MKLHLWAAILALSPCGASAADLCKARVLHPVRAVENHSSIAKAGGFLDSVTQFNRDRRTGRTSFCSHGGYCYPTHTIVRGKRVEAVRLTNCIVGKQSYADAEEISYSVEVVRSRNSSSVLREDDVENMFLAMGACSACADNIAAHYTRNPKGQCATLARQALEGNPTARKVLIEDLPSFCTYKY